MSKTAIDVEQQVQWLVDRAEVTDLVHKYARYADTKQWNRFAELFADDGVLVLPFGGIDKASMAEAAGRVLAPFESTHHLMANIAVEIDGDTATSNHYLQAIHLNVASATAAHADIGGWYNNQYRRTSDGWRIVSVDLNFVWSDGVEFSPGDPQQ